MKRTLLFLTLLGIVSYSIAQHKVIKVPAHLKNKAEKVSEKTPDPTGSVSQVNIIGQKYNEETVGETIYDLQTYNALQKRIYAYPDGTIGLTWIMGFETGTWSDRGTGYNYFDSQQWDQYPSERIESENTFGTNYAPYGENGELVVSHFLDDPLWKLMLLKREQKGEGNWEESYLSGPDDVSIAWPAVITNGHDNTYIHVLVVTVGGEYMGQGSALLYYRSSDGGQTWDIEHCFFDELGPDYFDGIPIDGYSWAASGGDTIAFSVGFKTQDGYIMKSFDNGDTWQKIIVYDSPYSPYQGGATPTYGAGDITQSVALDSQGKAHLVFGRMKYYYNNLGTLYYFPATEGVIYWNENMSPLDTTIISSYTLDFLINNGNLIGWVTPYNGDSTLIGWGSYYVSLTSYPQINIDEQDRIFILYSGVAAGYDNGEKNFRHIFGNSSNDGGLTWNGIKDFNTDINYLYSECMYSAMSPTFTDNKIHFFFECDPFPGLHVWTNEHIAVNNDIVYMSADISFLTGTEYPALTLQNSTEVSQNYPNPFNEKTCLIVKLHKKSHLHLLILNTMGQEVRNKDYGMKEVGKFMIEINRDNLPEGLYFYVISSGEDKNTGKMIIQY